MLNQHPRELSDFEDKASLSFKNKALLSQAFTHSSYLKRGTNNERLEFFGDAVLKLIVSEYLYFKYPHFDEGDLTKKRAQIVSDRLLSQLSSSLEVGEYMLFSPGEAGTGGAKKPSNLANAFEALLGAIYLDSGYPKAKDFFVNRLELAPESAKTELQDSKTILQEWSQKKSGELPLYTQVDENGPEHEKCFVVRVSVNLSTGEKSAEGKGVSKKRAEQNAAKRLLATLLA
jgi:ribonuclease III